MTSYSAPWQPTKIRWVDKILGTSTGASRVETDQGPAYAKLLGNPEGPQALFCDVVGTRVAAWLGLKTFDIAMIEVLEDGLVTYANGSRSLAGPAFIARELKGTTWGGTVGELHCLENPKDLAGLVVLDTWLLNCDRYRPVPTPTRRNNRNVFLAESSLNGKFTLVAMDHTHGFTCGHALTKAIGHIDRVQDPRLMGHFPEFEPFLTRKAFVELRQRLHLMTWDVARGFMAGIPSTWDIQPDVIVALADFLNGRAHFLRDRLLQMLVDQGPLQPELDV